MRDARELPERPSGPKTIRHLGKMQGMPGTGKPYTQYAIVIYRLTKGKIVEGWAQTDLLSMMQRLGLLPAPETT